MKLNKTIVKPIITEKTTELKEQNKYVFRVEKSASKHKISDAVEKLFNVEVVDVKTMIMPSKPKRVWSTKVYRFTKTKAWKKAIVTVKEGDEINYD